MSRLRHCAGGVLYGGVLYEVDENGALSPIACVERLAGSAADAQGASDCHHVDASGGDPISDAVRVPDSSYANRVRSRPSALASILIGAKGCFHARSFHVSST
jgi:hypothetical protein